jgi:hypothetical protein
VVARETILSGGTLRVEVGTSMYQRTQEPQQTIQR